MERVKRYYIRKGELREEEAADNYKLRNID